MKERISYGGLRFGRWGLARLSQVQNHPHKSLLYVEARSDRRH